MSYADVYDWRDQREEEADTAWYRANQCELVPPALIRDHNQIHVRMAEGHWLQFAPLDLAAAIEVYAEAERRYLEAGR